MATQQVRTTDKWRRYGDIFMCTDGTKSVVLLCAASILRYVCTEHQHEMQVVNNIHVQNRRPSSVALVV